MGGVQSYRYVGSADLVKLVASGSAGAVICSAGDFSRWMATRSGAELSEPFTFVIDLEGFLRLAPRRSEHVVCAGGDRVLSAGEISFVRDGERWAVGQVSNQSTGYCPDVESWAAVAAALDLIGLSRPARFTDEVVFRCCPACRERAVVKDGDFVCVFCGSDLPTGWNFDAGSAQGS